MGCNQSKISKAVVQQHDDKQPILNNKERNSSLLPNNTSIIQEEEEQQLLGKNNSNRSSSNNVDNSSRNEAVVGSSVRRNTVPSIDKRNSDVDATKKQRHSYASSGSSTNSPGYVSKTSDVSFNSVNAVQSSPGKANVDNNIDVNDTDKGIKETEVKASGKKKTAWSGKHKLRDTSSSSTKKDESSTHSIPPPPTPTLSTTDSAANAVNDPHWIQIYQKLSPSIIDPEDLSTIISSIISSQIDLLSPAEVSFIKKRVKYSLGFVINNEGGVEGDQGGLGGSEGNREGKERRKSALSKVGRKLGLNSSSNNLLPLGSKSTNPSSSLDLMHPALDESSDRTKTTKQIYKNEHTLDISTIRKIFENGDTCIKKLKRNVKEELVLFGMENSSASGSAGGSDRRNSTGNKASSSTTPRSSPTNNDNQTIAIQPKTTQQVNVDQISQVDIYGSTFLLLLHLSENRWEYITELAKVSAENANLILDVNKLCLLDEENKNGKGREKEIPPPSLALNPNITPPSNNTYGISFTSICYLISVSKFGTRFQRVQLLFYMLLPPKLLNELLKLHPAGNVPTWLLECDTNLIISYDSLSYYYVYDGVLLPNGDDNDSMNGKDKSRKKKKSLCIDAYSSVEVMASLVADSINGGGKVQHQSNDNEGTTAYGTRQLMISLLEMEDDDTTTHDVKEEVKCKEVHTMLQEQATSSSATTSNPNLSQSEMHDISKFAELAAALPLTNNTQHLNGTTTTNNNTNNTRLKWSLQDFIQWSNTSINETTLNIIMNKLFTTGILPTASMECELVESRWIDWNMLQDEYRLSRSGEKEKVNEDASSEGKVSSDGGDSAGQSTTIPAASRGGLRNLFTSNDTVSSTDQPSLTSENGVTTASTQVGDYNRVWGGIGGADGKGGLGQGVLYCIDKNWWDEWVAYTGYNLDNSSSSSNGRSRKRSPKRPRELSTERLIDRSPDSPFVSGSRGSYEMMKHRLVRDKDYVLIPPGVWNVLYEMYGGGPPLPRMVLPRSRLSVNGGALDDERGLVSTHNTDESVEITSSQHERSVRSNNAKYQQCPQAIPSSVRVATHSWLLHCQICDPQQPYRRGDAGPMSIRVMVMPNQPLWRVFSEIVVRLPISHSKARDSQGIGRARLWRFEVANGKPVPNLTYGPWALLCKNRYAEIPLMNNNTPQTYEKYEDQWIIYAGEHSVESIGLSDGMRLMFEFAIANKDGSFTWPREAAAKATTARRIADDDAVFRLLLRGLDGEGNPLKAPIIRKTVDAMDSTGRWYQGLIVNVDNTTNDATDDNNGASANENTAGFKENRHVRIHFNHTENHEEWIDVKSDRLAVLGRMTSGSVRNLDSEQDGDDEVSSETKPESKASRLAAGINKKKDTATDTSDASSHAVCLFPGYGACGLINLGNTCYANSGWQCMSYLPLLRSYLLSGQFKINGDINKDNPLGKGGKIIEEFSELLHFMWSGKFGTRAPQKFRSILAKCNSQYCGADQQDAQELLNDMLDMLHEDGNRVKKKPYVEALEDKFIEQTELPRVGQEAWRRFLRRNQSAISDLSMGQIYNKVTCPVCNHSSQNFDPFNMLSLPFPTVAEVIFQCTVVRRATTLNCPNTLPSVSKRHSSRDRSSRSSSSSSPSPPSKELIFEEYLIPMSRLADIGDLKMKLQHLSGIPIRDLRVCKREDTPSNAGDPRNSYTKMYTKVSALPDKEGPCIKLLQQGSGLDEVSSPTIARIIAFETTLRTRPTPLLSNSMVSTASSNNSGPLTDNDVESTTASEFSQDESTRAAASAALQNKLEDKMAQEYLKTYGDAKECVEVDTNPTPLAKVISRSLWPKSTEDFTLGLRVDAIDHRNHWFPGSVIEIVVGDTAAEESNHEDEDEEDEHTPRQPVAKVKIHFDNFSAKWDEMYSIDSFNEGRVRPLYSQSTPRPKPTEFVIHHRGLDQKTGKYYLFGQSFFIQCHNEWSTARAGAHILTQASRFIEESHFKPGNGHTLDAVDMKIMEKERSEARKLLSTVIEALIRNDRKYVESAIKNNEDQEAPFDVSLMSQKLSKKLSEVLPLLPFDVRVTTANSPLGTNDEEAPFPFSLVRTIGNYMNARHALVLHWKERPDHISNNSKSSSSSRKHADGPKHYLYSPPTLVPHQQSRGLLKEEQKDPTSGNNALKRHPSSQHGGLHVGNCLTEFCKEQQLDATGCWRCPQCKVDREGKQSMTLWNLPDLLTIHLKRFNASSRWREKISTRVDFPLTGLNMREWCTKESPLCGESDESFVYDLIGVVNHYGGMTGGHYVATCKATACSPEGEEEVAYNFNGSGTSDVDAAEEEATSSSSGWRLGRSKEKETSSNAAAKAVSESAEPLWLQFDDDLVEPVPPRNVVSETAYVLFYRRRRMHPSNIAKYTSLGC